MTVLVTGGHGFLGRHVVRAFHAQGIEPLAPRSREYDLTRQDAVEALFTRHRPRIVVHLAAACGGIGANVANPGRFLYENALMGLVLLEAARVHGCERFVLVSTTCAYPRDAPVPLREDTFWEGYPAGATAPYGLAKRMLHEACLQYRQQYGLKSTVLVPANLYGPEDHFDLEHGHVIPVLIRRFVEAKANGAPSVTCWGTGNATREFLHVRDAARAIVLASEKDTDGLPLNVGTGQETSIRELTEVIAAAVAYEGEILWDASKPEGQPRRWLEVSRAREALGFEAEIALGQGIAETVEFFRGSDAHARL